MDVEPTRAIRQAEVGSTKTMIERKRCSDLSITHILAVSEARRIFKFIESDESVVIPFRAPESFWRVLHDVERKMPS